MRTSVRDGRFLRILASDSKQIRTYHAVETERTCSESIRPHDLAREMHLPRVVIDGPRYWTVDEVVFDINQVRTLLCLEVRQVGEQTLPLENCTFRDHVQEKISCTYWSGRPVFCLLNDRGEVYVMQNYTTKTDPTLSLDKLAHLEPRLSLPEGWAFKVLSISKNLHVPSPSSTIWDRLGNMYQKLSSHNPIIPSAMPVSPRVIFVESRPPEGHTQPLQDEFPSRIGAAETPKWIQDATALFVVASTVIAGIGLALLSSKETQR